MNKYNKILEFDKIISILKDKVYLEKSKEELDNYVLFETLEEVKNSLDETYETSSLLQRMGRIPISITPNCDMDKIISKTTKGGILSLQELSETGNFLDTIKNNILYLDRVKNAKINCIHLEQIVNLFIYPKELNLEIKKVVTPYGELKEDASPLLKEIIKKERDTEKNIQIRLQEILHKNAAILSQQVISIRNDRYVLPVKNDYKNQLKGIIHDQSSSKETVFIEPLNNTLNQYKDEEQIEINRILRSLSNEISKYSEILYNDFKNLIFLDILFSKAQYGVDIEGSLPKVNQDGIVDLLGCYHPLLQVEHVVKNNISIGKDYKGIIITGPNTGGKTVLLKTIGLLSLMVKFGLLLPCDENSNIMIFDHIYR